MSVEMHVPLILLAALARTALVFLWWSPALFLTRWLILTNRSQESLKREMFGGALFAVAGSLLMAGIFDIIASKVGAHSALEGVLSGFALWLGFVMPAMLSSVVYEKKSFELFLINVGFQLAALLSMGAILCSGG